MKPACYVPTRVESEDPAWLDRRKRLLDFCKDIQEKAQLIPYTCVSDGISRKIANFLTHPNTLRTDRWTDVMAKLGYADPVVQGQVLHHENWQRGEEADTAFFLFLTRIYAKDGGTLWQVINILSQEMYTDVMEHIKIDISEFVSSYSPQAVNQKICKNVPLDTFDSGVGQSFSTSGSPSHLSRGPTSIVGHVQSPPQNRNFLVSPPREHLVILDNWERPEDMNQSIQDNFYWPKKEPFSNTSFLNDTGKDDYNFEYIFPFEKKSSKAIKVFIPHTYNEEDEEIAEEVARRLEEEYQFETYLLKNMNGYVNMEIADFVFKLMENVDFLVPVLSRAYLEEIVPVGDTNEMPPHRLVLRYIHAVSQTRVINKNSLNYLIRPLIIDDVNYGMVRRWHEFQSAVKYPKDLGRLAKNLKATKEILTKKKYGWQ